MSSVFYRDLRSPPEYANCARGEEILIHSGRERLVDLSSGAGITCLGHSCLEVKSAMYRQIEDEPYVHSMNFTHPNAEILAEKLLELVTRDYISKFIGGRVFFLNSGAEAVEAACKLAAQYGQERGKLEPAYIARAHSYHGNTMFTMGLGDHPRKSLYPYIPNPVCFRMAPFALSWGKTDSLKELNLALESSFHGKQPIVVVEPIGGTTLGIEPPTSDYITALIGMCEKNNAVLVFDEVLSGNFRTGSLFAYQHYTDLEPDIICVGKGLTAGYFPLSAVIVSKKIVDQINAGSAKLWHSTTNQNHPIGCAAGVAALDVYRRRPMGRLSSWIEQARYYLLSAKCIEGVVGVGTLWGIRLDRDLPGYHLKVRQLARQNGLAVYTEGQTVDGKGNFVLLAPPYSITKKIFDDAIDRLGTTIVKASTL